MKIILRPIPRLLELVSIFWCSSNKYTLYLTRVNYIDKQQYGYIEASYAVVRLYYCSTIQKRHYVL